MTLNEKYINPEEIDMFRNAICDKIRMVRISKGITQGQLAEAVGIGRSHVCRIESGKFNFSLSHLLYIMKVLGIDSIDLLKANEMKKPGKKDYVAYLNNIDSDIDKLNSDRTTYINICADEALQKLTTKNTDKEEVAKYKYMANNIKGMANVDSVDLINYLTSLSEKQLKGAIDGVSDELSSAFADEMLTAMDNHKA